MKNKTVAVWLTFLLGSLGLHRRYLLGRFDLLALLLPIPTLLGLYGVYRARSFGVDDQLSWVLIPLLGFTLAGCALNAIVYGLQGTEAWNRRHNPGVDPESAAGVTHGFTVFGLAVALMVGTTVLMASLAFSIQRYFEYQAVASVSAHAVPLIKRSAG
ncbi:MAG: hypothetical protein U5M53_07170 [Rhodoferax sp.]|nr:hypothetical protein [Rhodoferax sp.]